MQPRLNPELASVLRELRQREPIFHRPELGTTRADFERMTADDFWEIGASGKVYDRAFVLDMLEERHRTPQPETLHAFDFSIRQLSADTWLLHYTLLQETRRSRRTTVWTRTSDGWKIVFHQGTIVQG